MRRFAVATLSGLTILGTILVASPAPASDLVDSTALRNAVKVSGIAQHEVAFQQIANANGGVRASGTDYSGAKLVR